MNIPKILLHPLSTLTQTHLNYFQSILPSHLIQTENLDSFNTDWLGKHKGNSKLVLKPNSVPQIQQILKYCNQELLAIVPQSGNTSQLPGSVPNKEEIILSLKNLNKIEEIDQVRGIVLCDSGVVLDDLSSFCSEQGWVVPLDLGSKSNCLIGGNISTNAAGARLLKNGSLFKNVLGLEVVLPSGEILSDLKVLKKHKTRLNLFIGSNGTLGVITKVALLLTPKPASVNTCFLSLKSYSDVVRLLKLAKEILSEILSAYEFIDRETFQII